jgi:hypothetical protein
MTKFLLVAFTAVVAIILFLFFIGGGFDKFKPPISIVLPANHTGAFCVEIVGPPDDQNKGDYRYEADPNGNLRMPEGLLRSHRYINLFRRSQNSSVLQPVPASDWTPIRTEGGQSGTATFVLHWVGPTEALRSNTAADAQPMCPIRK